MTDREVQVMIKKIGLGDVSQALVPGIQTNQITLQSLKGLRAPRKVERSLDRF